MAGLKKQLNMMEGHSLPPGPSIAERIGQRIAEAWMEGGEAIIEDEDGAPLPAYIAGLATALAVLRYAPAMPDTAQIAAIAEEYHI